MTKVTTINKKKEADLANAAQEFASLKAEIKVLESKADKLKEILTAALEVDGSIEGDDFTIIKFVGKTTFSFTCNDEIKRKVQENLIQKGWAERKEGAPYLRVTYKKAE